MPRNQNGDHLSNWHATTILCLRKDNHVVVAGDGQVSMGDTIVKSNALKIRRLAADSVITGFAGATADAFTLFEKLEEKLERYPANMTKAVVELAKDWRMDRYLRRLDALLAVADENHLFLVSGTGDVIEPDDGIAAVGSGGSFAVAAARALARHSELSPEEIATEASVHQCGGGVIGLDDLFALGHRQLALMRPIGSRSWLTTTSRASTGT